MHSNTRRFHTEDLSNFKIKRQFKIDIHECQSLCESYNSIYDVSPAREIHKKIKNIHKIKVNDNFFEIEMDNKQVEHNYCCTSGKQCQIF